MTWCAGDLGQSITSTGTQVIDQIARYLPWTLFCVGLGLLLSFVIGMLFGMLIAYYPQLGSRHLHFVFCSDLGRSPGLYLGDFLF